MKAHELTPEKRLISAVILEAIRDIKAGSDEEKESARFFFLDQSFQVKSLNWYLWLLGLNVREARARLLQSITGELIGKNQSVAGLMRGIRF